MGSNVGGEQSFCGHTREKSCRRPCSFEGQIISKNPGGLEGSSKSAHGRANHCLWVSDVGAAQFSWKCDDGRHWCPCWHPKPRQLVANICASSAREQWWASLGYVCERGRHR